MNTLAINRSGKIQVSPAENTDSNMSVTFVKSDDRRVQTPLIDAGELYYNPSTKTLHADNFSGGIPSLIEGEGIKLTTADNRTIIDVNFDANTATTTTVSNTDALLLQDGLGFLKTITGTDLKADLKTGAGDNLSYGTGSNINKLNLDPNISNTSLDNNCSWNGNLISAPKISNGSVSDAEFQRLNGLTSSILQTSDKGADSGVCALDSNGFVPTANLPASIDDIRNFADVAAFPEIGEDPPPEAGIIYVALDSRKSYRWNGLASGTNAQVYTEITNGLVLGTGAGTAFEGSSCLLYTSPSPRDS